MVEDAWEEIAFHKDGMVIDAFNAWICKETCGYYEEIEWSHGDE
ncbi:MAG TPA: hypothetical protein VNM45_03175 [Bacillus sp. (in: firmicutes)]|nr:hypothetical protein [Bacillus sp. (in: firmicutes)]